ncbi:hypothetical protein BB559_005222 [Furculomyces boomerangus]|uniref:Indoleamine 2,3-dioxygenase n=2 Tax=Harpellales TaxID=61421 RepID=A0A2T9Y2Z2_9FUNG|nr:hypothetical protein BB559_006427 [Furculomyces boomerangus]PVU89154.1 hypothetical protein BB559_005222 [Furculomyces boomerangus]PWA01914.1 hypothetical protein BB558_001933 [Smittium angustum]
MGSILGNNDWSFMPLSLREYDVSENCGFLSDDIPLQKLDDEYYQPWEYLITEFVSYQVSGKFREKILELPLLSTEHLKTLPNYKRAYMVLAYLVHGYVWSIHKKPEEKIPKCLAVPFCQVSEYLGLNPVTSYASLVLWNWKTMDKTEDMMSLDNLTTIFNFTGSPDEVWFDLISTAIEVKGGKVIYCAGKIIRSIQSNNLDGVVEGIDELSKGLKESTKILTRMYEKCDPYIFFHKIRPYLAGWDGIETNGLKRGILYEGTDELDPEKEYKKFVGGNAAQSSVFQAVDIILGIRHYSDDSENEQNQRNESVKPPGNPYLLEMRGYMPGQHRRFLIDLEKVCKLREYVLNNTVDVSKVNNQKFTESIEALSISNESKTSKGHFPKEKQTELLKSYNKCISTLKTFRDAHLVIVKTYVVDEAMKLRNQSSEPSKTPTKSESEKQNNKDQPENSITGTGGSNPIVFLKKLRDETTESRLK